MPSAQPKCTLEPAELSEQSQADELFRQRQICGWKTSLKDIASWQERTQARTTTLFWIKPTAQPDLRAGHISLVKASDSSDLTISDLFVLPEHRGGGIARAAFETLEDWATTEPYGSKDCKALLVDTLSRKYSEDDEYRLKYIRLTGVEPKPKGATNEEWYTRMGYVKYKEEPKYPAREGRIVEEKLLAVFMRKELR
ncbi:hypothetical protein Daus18300_006241 [Diaporthe australafricana]|uniref:N-acetyltransferase domain-containing protein n=1 Tax=Diaporthe australafricana TaxID=127596 RepID=A0ABR3WVJ2_9PEZI